MADRLEELPLFPLNTVVFPYAHMQVHVFEGQYQEMIRHCMTYDRGFGICLIRSGSETGAHAEPYMVGTAVRIVKVQTHSDGKMDVEVQGERRFRIRRIDESQPFMVGHVEPLVEMEIEETARAGELMGDIRESLMRYLQLAFQHADVRVASIRLPDDATALSFVVANLLQCENRQKQHLLETTDTVERMEEMLPLLEEQIELEGGEEETVFQRLTAAELLDWASPN
jgi:Lon protease-like protein